jgi:hypothetical protein
LIASKAISSLFKFSILSKKAGANGNGFGNTILYQMLVLTFFKETLGALWFKL